MQASLKKFKSLDGRFLANVPMKRYTTMRVGGVAAAFYQPYSAKGLVECIKLCNKIKISLLAIGGGSNIIISDKLINKVFIKFDSPYFKKIKKQGNILYCGAGVMLSALCYFAERNSLGGCEFLVGIPGTVGGAVIQNAGAQDNSISDIIKEVTVVDNSGNIKILDRQDIKFGYRESALSGFFVIEAALKLKKKAQTEINKEVRGYIQKRLVSQDYTAPSAGCIFKNPKKSRMSAGEIIDKCRLKGKMIGGAAVSERHANFIINKRNATAKDILGLIALIKKEVNNKFNIKLEEEVKVIR